MHEQFEDYDEFEILGGVMLCFKLDIFVLNLLELESYIVNLN